MEEEPTFQTYGFDTFIGKAIRERNYIDFVSLDMRGLGSHVFCQPGKNHLDFLLEKLCLAVRNREKVLLCKSPGRIGLREVLVNDWVDIVKRSVSGDENYPVKKIWEVDEPATYEALNPEELRMLQEMYERRKDMKLFPNPFLYQPE